MPDRSGRMLQISGIEQAQTITGLAGIYIDMEEYGNAIRCTEHYRTNDSTNIAVNQKNAQAYCLAQKYPEELRCKISTRTASTPLPTQ